MIKVFIDGREGTTGLRIDERLAGRKDIEIIRLDDAHRKDDASRKEALNSCDIAFLCLPDEAAISAVAMIDNPNVRVIDASTAHRTNPDWVYGLPELSAEQFQKIKNSKRVAVPGCHASGFVALVKPLVDNGLLSSDAKLCCNCVTGYSGGGKKMIAEYESKERSFLLDAPRQYGITQMHKHLKEMKGITGLKNEPVFSPIVADFYSGMLMTVQLFADQLNGKRDQIIDIYKNLYNSPILKFNENIDQNGFLSATALKQKDSMQVGVLGNDERILLVAVYDNLGKGASGAAVECMNIMTGNDSALGLEL